MNVPALKDPKTGKPSITLTAFVVGFAIVNIKLLLSDIQITESFQMSTFTGVDYSAAVAALGGIYVMRKNKTIKEEKQQ